MIIPYEEIQPETLSSLIESFVLREGTDYGNDEVSFKVKTEQIMNQICTGKIVIVYSELHQTCDLVVANQFKKK